MPMDFDYIDNRYILHVYTCMCDLAEPKLDSIHLYITASVISSVSSVQSY